VWGEAVRKRGRETRRGLYPPSRDGLLPLLQRNAAIHRASLLFVHLRPAYDFLERALAAPAHIVAQHRAAMADAGTFCRNIEERGRRVQVHGAVIIYLRPRRLLQPRQPCQRLRAMRRTSPAKAASCRRKQGAHAGLFAVCWMERLMVRFYNRANAWVYIGNMKSLATKANEPHNAARLLCRMRKESGLAIQLTAFFNEFHRLLFHAFL